VRRDDENGADVTSYLVRYNQANITGSIAIRAVTYEIKLTQINWWSWGGSSVFYLYRHENSTMTGGTTINVVPLRQGAPAATATAMQGAISFSGTQRVIGNTYLPPGSTSTAVGASVITTYPGSTTQIQPALTTTVLPGSVLHVAPGPLPSGWAGISETVGCEISFEELRLSGSN
jgi:hypothetical protein